MVRLHYSQNNAKPQIIKQISQLINWLNIDWSTWISWRNALALSWTNTCFRSLGACWIQSSCALPSTIIGDISGKKKTSFFHSSLAPGGETIVQKGSVLRCGSRPVQSFTQSFFESASSIIWPLEHQSVPMDKDHFPWKIKLEAWRLCLAFVFLFFFQILLDVIALMYWFFLVFISSNTKPPATVTIKVAGPDDTISRKWLVAIWLLLN